MNIYLRSFIRSRFSKPGIALDLGAGDFFDVACLKQLGWRCEGVDIKTGVNLERPYLSKHAPFDLVFSNYVLHKLKNKEQLVKTAFRNLRVGGWFFVHTFDRSDKNSSSTFTKKNIKALLGEQGFKNISAKVFSYYDNDEDHKHWHKILEATAQK